MVVEKLVISTRLAREEERRVLYGTELEGGVCGVLQAERGVSGVLKMEQRPTSGSEAPLV
jgi:hypothetical protein